MDGTTHKIVDYLDGFQIEERDSRIPKKRRNHIKKNNEQTHTATLASFDLEILNFQILNRPFGMEHKVYVNPGALDFKTNTDSGNGTKITNVLKTDYLYKYNDYGAISFEKAFDEHTARSAELQDELGLGWWDYGARGYMPDIGRWVVVDGSSEIYYALTPYNYAGNTPVQAVDVDGNLFIFVNGFMGAQWAAGQQNPTISYASPDTGYQTHPNPLYSKYAPDRGFYTDGARNNGKTFRYWTNEGGKTGVNLSYQQAYNDNNAYYTNGSFTPKSTAQTRFAEGAKAAAELIRKLESGEISLADGETIKIVGHSQGAAYAAGLATELLKHSVYGSRIEFVDYIEAHQPKDFESPEGLLSRQFLTWSDWVAGKGLLNTLGANGGSENGCIKNVTDCQQRDSYKGGRGGHSVNTYLDYIVDYFRRLGIPVTETK